MSCIHWQNRVENNNENCQKAAAAAAAKEKLSWLDLSRSQRVVADGEGEGNKGCCCLVVYSGCSQSITKLQFGILSVLRQVTAAKCGRKLAKYWLWPFCQQVSAGEEEEAAAEEEEEEEDAAEDATFLNTTWRERRARQKWQL